MIQSNKDPNYSLPLQFAMMDLVGKKWDGTAGYFTDNRVVARALKEAIRKIRARLDQILTTDDRLRMLCFDQTDALESEIKSFSHGQDNLLEVVAHLLSLVAFLIGFDYHKGVPNRQVIYYQTKDQQEIDNRALLRSSPTLDEKSEYYQLVEIATLLRDRQFPLVHIAKIMNRPRADVKHWLNQSERLAHKK